ncbi:MAG TPA: DUF5134 domain-containing protein [Pseudonocardia sp.]
MSSWLGVGLACAFGLVAVRRGLGRDVPGSLMATGMALMSLDMTGFGPAPVHGPWWAAGFASVAVWPVFRRSRGGRSCAKTAHLLGGVAMVLMCALPGMPAMTPSATGAGTPVPGGGQAMAGQAMAGMGSVDLPGEPTIAPGPLGVAAALLGFALACYFLLATIIALTRHNTGGAATASRLTRLDEATMGLGTVVMLTMFT